MVHNLLQKKCQPLSPAAALPARKTMRMRLFYLAVLTAMVGTISLSTYAQHMTGGLRVVNEPIYVNVYWDNNWDANMTGTPLGSRASLEFFTRTVIGGSYFDGLGQYGVHSPSFGGSSVMGSASPATVDEEQIRMFAAGLWANPPSGFPTTDHGRTIYNIFLAPGTTLVSNTLSTSAFGIVRTPQSTIGGYHSCTPVPGAPVCLPYTVVFTANPGGNTCTHGPLLTGNNPAAGVSSVSIFNRLTRTLTHEMVETATDPDGTSGWRDRTVSNGEIADFGSNPATCFLSGNTADYWSNDTGGTISGHNDSTPPVIASITRVGRGRELMLEIHGQGFGPPPTDLPTLPTTGKTQFLIVRDSTTNVVAGHPATATNLDLASWRDDEIIIRGSDNAAMSAQHAISIQVFGRTNGQASAVFTLAAAAPQTVFLEAVPSMMEAGPGPFMARGRVLDQFGNPFLTSLVRWRLSGPDTTDFSASGEVPSDLDGWFHVSVPLSHSGTYLLSVSVPLGTTPHWSQAIQIFPRIVWLDPNHYALGTPRPPVTIHGFGLAEVTEVGFGSVIGIVAGRSPDGEWTRVNPPPFAGVGGNQIGWVDVVARVVRGSSTLQSSIRRNDLFAYYQAGIPILQPAPEGFECNPAFLTAVIWDTNGNPVTDNSLASNIRFRTNRGSFSNTGQVTEFTPTSMYTNQATASLYEGAPGTQEYLPSVGLANQDGYRSSRQVNFNDQGCAIVQQSRGLRDLVGRMSIRDLLTLHLNQPIPKDQFANVAEPLQVQIEMVLVRFGKNKVFSHEVRVTIKDAKGNPVSGLGVAFVATAGGLQNVAPVVTDGKGVARMAVRPSQNGTARIVAIVERYQQPVTAQIKK